MIKKISFSDFRNEFVQADKERNFSALGLTLLFDYLEKDYLEIEEEYQLNVIELCHDYSENKLSQVLSYYNLESLKELQDRTWAVSVDESNVIYKSY